MDLPSTKLQVIGAGFGRTGTTSLKKALQTLGYGKCYHMSDVNHNDHAEKWLRKENQGIIDWDEVLRGYKSSVDWPTSLYYEELAERYPSSKIILTVRDEDSWYESIMSTVYKTYTLVPAWRRWLFPKMGRWVEMLKRLIWDGVFHGRLEDAEYAKKIFRDHNNDVKRKWPADRLLVFDVRDGWKPLCDFLGKPVPDNTPFPHSNLSKDSKRKIRKLRMQGLVPYAIASAVVLMMCVR
jgi:hypothetical protein